MKFLSAKLAATNEIIMAEDLFKQVISHSKEYGFVFQSSEIYDGLSAVYDYGQQGVALKNTYVIITFSVFKGGIYLCQLLKKCLLIYICIYSY